MATYRNPVQCFAPLEVIERLLEIREEEGYRQVIFLISPEDLAASLDAYGFDVFSFENETSVFHFGDYRGPLAPNGDHAHGLARTH